MELWAKKLLDYAGALKEVSRTGWVKRGVPNSESVADHTYRMALMALVYAPLRSLDPFRCVAMIIIHDLAEARTGDIVALVAEERTKKLILERQAIYEIFAGHPDSDYYISLFEEYVRQESPIAKFAKELDKLDTGVQAKRYMQLHPELDLHILVREAEEYLKDSELLALL